MIILNCNTSCQPRNLNFSAFPITITNIILSLDGDCSVHTLLAAVAQCHQVAGKCKQGRDLN